MSRVLFQSLLGATCHKIVRRPANEGADDYVDFYTNKGLFRMAHQQDCCESVDLTDVCGDFDDLIGYPILVAEEASDEGDRQDPGVRKPDDCDETWTWTFYTISTIKGSVVMRWFGTSNGYYSESVDLYLRDGSADCCIW